MATAAFNASGSLNLPAMYFAGTLQGAPFHVNLLRCVVTAYSIGRRQQRVLTQAIPRLSGARARHFGVEPVDLTLRADLEVAAISDWNTYLSHWALYRIGGEFSFSDIYGTAWSYVEFQSIELEDQAWGTTSYGSATRINTMTVRLRALRP